METINLNFRAIDRYVESNIVLPTEGEVRGKDFISWGEQNDYPDYLNGLYESVATLHSIIEGTVDFIRGDEVSIDDLVWNERINDKDETIEELVSSISRDLLKYGGFAINVLRNNRGDVASLYYIPLERIRSNDDNSVFFYSKDWGKSYGRVKYQTLPKFDVNAKDASSIYFYSNNKTNVYPSPLYAAAVTACEIEKNVNTYHLNALANGFAGSYLINMNNGVPADEQKEEIEEYINEKFSGADNAGRIVISFNDNKEHAAELQKLDTEDYGEKYKSLVERTKSEIFCSFRVTPNLFGIPTATTGFNEQEYQEAFKLYNRTTVSPLQKVIVRALNKITGRNVTITPFTLEGAVKSKIIDE